MATGLFSITCTTCQARLRVRNLEAIGQILACPRCQSMVQVLPPPGWSGQAAQTAAAAVAAETPPPAAAPPGMQQAAHPVQPAQAVQPLPPLTQGQSLHGGPTARPSPSAQAAANAADSSAPAAVQATSANIGAESQSQWFDGSDAAFHSRLHSAWRTPLACERAQGTPWFARLAEMHVRLASGIAQRHLGLYAGAAALVVCIATGAWILLARRSTDENGRGPTAVAQAGESGTPSAAHQPPTKPATARDSGRSKRAGTHASRKQPNSGKGRMRPKAAAAHAGQGSDPLAPAKKPSPRQPTAAKDQTSEPHGDLPGDETPVGVPTAEKQDDEGADSDIAAGDHGPVDNAASQDGTDGDGAGDGLPARPPTSDAEIELVPGEPEVPEPETAGSDVPDADEIEARLQVPLAAIELPDIALGEAIDILAQLASVRIELDVEALGDAGRSPGDRVRVSLTQTTVAEALAAVLAQYNLAYDVRQGVIWIRPR